MAAVLPTYLTLFGGSYFSLTSGTANATVRVNSAGDAFEQVTIYTRAEADSTFADASATTTALNAKLANTSDSFSGTLSFIDGGDNTTASIASETGAIAGASLTATPAADGTGTIRVNNAAGTASVRIGTWTTSASYGGIYFGSAAPSATNYALIGTSTETLLNVASGGLVLIRVGNATVGQFSSSVFNVTGNISVNGVAATSANTASAIVARDANGDFSARALSLGGSGLLGVGEVALTDNTARRIQSYSGKPLYINELGNSVILNGTGKLLVGTATDDGTNKLQVSGGIKASDATRATLTLASGTRSLLFESYAADINYLTSSHDFGIFAASGKAINFYPNATLALKLQSSGNVTVGIGTDDGVNKLQVAGSIISSTTIATGTYTVATLPTAGTARRMAYASNGRKNGEGAAAGTGVLVFDDGVAWRAVDTGATVAA